MFSRFHVNSWVKGVSTTEGREGVSMRRTEGKEEWEKEESIWRERTAHAEENHADMGLCVHERLAGGKTKAGLAKSVYKSSFSWVFEKWPHCAVWVGMMFEILLPQCPGVLSRLADVHLWAQICKSTTLLGGKSGVEGGGSPCWGLGGACSDRGWRPGFARLSSSLWTVLNLYQEKDFNCSWNWTKDSEKEQLSNGYKHLRRTARSRCIYKKPTGLGCPVCG